MNIEEIRQYIADTQPKNETEYKTQDIAKLRVCCNRLLKEVDSLTKVTEQQIEGLSCLAIEAVERDLELAKLELEVQHWANAEEQGRLVVLPVPIGAPIYVTVKDIDIDGSVIKGVEELHLSGYIKEGDREFYTTYDNEYGTSDVNAGDLHITREEAEAALVSESVNGGIAL